MAGLDKSAEKYQQWSGAQAGARAGEAVGPRLIIPVEPSSGFRERLNRSVVPESANVENYAPEPWSPDWDKRKEAWDKKTEEYIKAGRLRSGAEKRQEGSVIYFDSTYEAEKPDDAEVVRHIRQRPR
jgi:hypothetical protein